MRFNDMHERNITIQSSTQSLINALFLLTITKLIKFNECVCCLSDGFAFSQEEGGAVSQTDIIRAYNTNIPKPDGM